MKEVGLYIPCFNAEKTIAACLDAVFRQDYPIVEVIVVDDGSTDRTAEIVSLYRVRILRHAVNSGLAAARNTAVKNVNMEFIASLDADCVADGDWLSRLMKRLDVPEISGAGGKVLEDRASSVFDQWRSIHMKQHWDGESAPPQFLFGANTVFRRDAVVAAGYYNESFRTNYEDVDLCRRIIGSGGQLVYEPAAITHHLKEDDMASLFHAFWEWHREYYLQRRFYVDSDSLLVKIQDNVGLANRYLKEDLACSRNRLLYLDFFLAIHHSIRDLECFISCGTEANGAKSDPKISSWLAMADLIFFYHYSEQKESIPSFLGQKERLSLNLFALIFTIDRCIGAEFGNGRFKQLLYKHLLFAIYKANDDVLLEKLLNLLERHGEWGVLLKKEHPHLNRYFLKTAQMIDQWLGHLKVHSEDIIELLKSSQEETELDFQAKELFIEN